MRRIDKLWRAFLWKGSDQVHGGHCLVHWSNVCKPKKLGGLGIKDLSKFGRALRLRWLWKQWTDASRDWGRIELPIDSTDRALFMRPRSSLLEMGVLQLSDTPDGYRTNPRRTSPQTSTTYLEERTKRYNKSLRTTLGSRHFKASQR
ncbi:hypothetical protein E2562_014461 [Oryza meyeriana var. granulata]|uniref:Reverse transcriptase zinc-binding domain-containing protein n=1 Tax=Oryza meyeriana var. granulata TaxID=110450 RepID=A0A6G1CPY9_9ORYZ|nr:hypothetical protein E2562_014461 [Oryza meyeriana var. granulata]